MPKLNKTAIINVVGLSKRIIGSKTPFLKQWVEGKNLSYIDPSTARSDLFSSDDLPHWEMAQRTWHRC